MTTTSKTLLALAVGLFAIGCTRPGSEFVYGILKPLAAVLAIVVFLLEILPEESSEPAEDPPAPKSRRHPTA
jgi:hypothetical protein